MLLLVGLSAGLSVGCGWQLGGGGDVCAELQDEDPAVRLAAVHRAGRQKVSEAAPYLVDRLTDSEEEVRMFAVLALERVTGVDRASHPYRYYHDALQREKAADWWRERIRERREGEPSTQPAGASGQ
ncbi:MAG: HEAT repeat domain-containing protein [Phycisphaerae bacterium]|nr:HEAT repeat domain-containing protein [Phycisphaerae bacterium]